MKKILITAFEPFGEDTVNPTEEILKALPDHIVSASSQHEAELIKLVLPVSFKRAQQIAEEAVRRIDPDIIISLGLAGGRAAITPERIAVNCMDARIPDNDGYQPEDLPVVPDGPAAYFSTLPVKRIREAVRTEGIPSELSNSAGTYVCNAVMYRMLHLAAKAGGKFMAGFIHVPYIEEMKKEPSIALEDEILAIESAIKEIL